MNFTEYSLSSQPYTMHFINGDKFFIDNSTVLHSGMIHHWCIAINYSDTVVMTQGLYSSYAP